MNRFLGAVKRDSVARHGDVVRAAELDRRTLFLDRDGKTGELRRSRVFDRDGAFIHVAHVAVLVLRVDAEGVVAHREVLEGIRRLRRLVVLAAVDADVVRDLALRVGG